MNRRGWSYIKSMTTQTKLTESQVENLWRVASFDRHAFLTEMCERWLDSDAGSDRQVALGKTIRSYVKGSSLESLLG